MLKKLIIGSSQAIKDTFKKKYKSFDIKFVKFRELWKKRNISKFDIIILSGFHRTILKKNIYFLHNYIKNYYKFILYLSKRSKNLYVISTFIPNKFSLSRNVYFYKHLGSKILKKKNIKILSFNKIISKKLEKKFIFIILKFLNFKLTNQIYLIKNTHKFIIKKIPNPRFLFLKVRRNIFFERILRIFDLNY